jgi:hypothetical protein
MWRSMLPVVSLTLSLAALADAEERHHSRVRALDAWAGESLERGLSSSSLVRELVQELERSDLIVHIDSTTRMSTGLAGITRFVGRTGESRYARITLARDLYPDARAAALAHELQHAIELAHSDARSHVAMQQLFERIGYRTDRKRRLYETEAAKRAGARAWIELRARCEARRCSQEARVTSSDMTRVP